jgi:hypothetical protein
MLKTVTEMQLRFFHLLGEKNCTKIASNSNSKETITLKDLFPKTLAPTRVTHVNGFEISKVFRRISPRASCARAV